MDIFKYDLPNTWLNGSAINGYDSVSWTERYREPGEFEIVARLSSGVKERLPIGTFISHLRTLEVMMVENHQISEEDDSDPIVKITGRSIQALLEGRIVGQNWNWASPPASLEVSQYVLTAALSWLQAVKLIQDHVQVGIAINSGDVIPLVTATHTVTGTGTSEERTISRGDVLAKLIDILEVDDLGCRIIRAHNWVGYPSPGVGTKFVVHRGVDKSATVVFSAKNGDIEAADFLWSIKKYKTGALVSGRYVEQFVAGSSTGANRRIMLVDGSDLDGHLEAVPVGAALTTIRSKMTVRGNAALKAQKKISISRIDISSTPTYEYRRDYDIGDFVSVNTNYGAIVKMRIIEHVEIEDENGQSAHPTLEILET